MKTAPKIENLQGLRGMAVLLVVLNHLGIYFMKFTGSKPWFLQFSKFGESGVDLFFVISGFVMVYISMITKRERTPINFLTHRMIRIYPLYWLISLIYLTLVLIYPSLLNRGDDCFHEINLVRSFLLIPWKVSPLIGQGWTLVYEMYFYMIFTLFLLIPDKIVICLSLWTLSLLGADLWGGQASILMGNDMVNSGSSPVLHVVTDCLSFEFIAGCFVALIVANGVHAFPGAAISLSLLGYAMGTLFLRDYNRVIIYGIPSVLLIYGVVVLEMEKKIILPRFMRLIGDASYSLYLIHLLVLSTLFRCLVRTFQTKTLMGGALSMQILTSVAAVSACILMGALVHVLVEKPLLNQCRIRLRKARS